MIRYALKCSHGHQFESWFQSASGFEALRASGLVCCAICGSDRVEKAVMAPRVHVTHPAPKAPETPASNAPLTPLSQPASPAEQALQALRHKIEQSSDYVGGDFAQEARRIHAGDAPARPIWGEAKASDAKALVEEGVPVAPLPWIATSKMN